MFTKKPPFLETPQETLLDAKGDVTMKPSSVWARRKPLYEQGPRKSSGSPQEAQEVQEVFRKPSRSPHETVSYALEQQSSAEGRWRRHPTQ